jgi:hypothetical protein
MGRHSKKWYCKFPLDAYALGPWDFEYPITEAEFREYIRKWEGVKRLPRGFQCWPTSDGAD